MLDFPRWKIAIILTVCFLSVLFSVPTFLSPEQRAHLPQAMRDQTVNLGLDLQGGSHLLLKVDFDAYLKEQLTNLTDEIRTKLRADKIGYKGLAVKDGKVVFALREETGMDIPKILREVDSGLKVDRLDSGEYAAYYSEESLRIRKGQILDQSLQIVDRRVNETGTREPIIQRQGEDRILLQVPGLQNPEHLKELLGRTAKMTFHLVNLEVSPDDIARGNVPPGTRIVLGDAKEAGAGGQPHRYAIYSKAELSGDMLVDARPSFHQQTGEPIVDFKLNNAGAKKFGDVTTANAGKPFAIVLDNKVLTAPRIDEPILGGSAFIRGSFTVESANDLALLLRAGALPAPLTVVEERTVGPSLGEDSIHAGAKASLIGVGLVIAFMIINYGLFGLFANIALIVNGLIVFALLALFHATLTLPGIAGIVLTLGMAVDTNVLIYERIREEIRHGKSPFAAVESGFRMAFGTIIDSHLTTLSAALLLYYFGTGTVKGFAVTLSIGLTASLFTAVMFTRLLIVTWLRRTRPKLIPI